MRGSVVFGVGNGCIVVFDESTSFIASGLTISSIGFTVDEGEGEGNSVEMTIFLSRGEIKSNSRSESKILPHMIASDATAIAVMIVRFR
jgi:hypothetical protein